MWVLSRFALAWRTRAFCFGNATAVLWGKSAFAVQKFHRPKFPSRAVVSLAEQDAAQDSVAMCWQWQCMLACRHGELVSFGCQVGARMRGGENGRLGRTSEKNLFVGITKADRWLSSRFIISSAGIVLSAYDGA